MMRFNALCAELARVRSIGATESHDTADSHRLELVDVVHDSRQARPGSIFCAVPGLTVDGHAFAPEAAANGAAALLVERWVDVDRPQIKVPNMKVAMPHAAAAVHGRPSQRLAIFGITGTNGKTTTTQLFADIMRAAGRNCSVIGTLGGVHTTPESTDLQRRLRSDADDGVEVIAIEVSSHALDQGRVDATDFAVAAFSNLTPDHLDYHGDMDNYFAAKSALFDGRAAVELVNVDDPWGERLAQSRAEARRLSLTDVQLTSESLSATVFTWRGTTITLPMPGTMNVANALTAAEAARCLGVDPATIARGLGAARPVSGRMEVVPAAGTDLPTVIVDYSHTPDSIDRALSTIRSISPDAEVSIVFGCGGDRDRSKRPLMAQAAVSGADRVFLTSDNPRSEDPMVIIEDALNGLSATEQTHVTVEADRREAIDAAITSAAAGSVVLIAGKGHEKTQTIGVEVLPFDDVEVASGILNGDSE